MYNRLYQYLTENEIFYPTKFGFQAGHSTEHAIVQLVDQIFESFEYNKYTLMFSSTFLKPLIESIIQYFLKNWNYMVQLNKPLVV